MLLNCACTSESTHPEGLQHGDRSCLTSLIRVDLLDRRARGRWLVSQQPRLVGRDSVPRLHIAESSSAGLAAAIQADMKGTLGAGVAALCLIFAFSSHCSGLLHTAEPLPVGQLDTSTWASFGRQLLQASRHALGSSGDLQDGELTMSQLELEEEALAEAEAEALEPASSLDTERVTKESTLSGRFFGIGGTSSWPTFGLVGERQAALYYSVCLLFTVFFFKNSGLRQSLMSIARANSHGKSARLGA